MATHIPRATPVGLKRDDHGWWLDDGNVLFGGLLALRDADDVQAADLSGSEAGARTTRSGSMPTFRD
jgi:hypothetical protein